jgi:hypothetical protein
VEINAADKQCIENVAVNSTRFFDLHFFLHSLAAVSYIISAAVCWPYHRLLLEYSFLMYIYKYEIVSM